jgi:hypothetical protein
MVGLGGGVGGGRFVEKTRVDFLLWRWWGMGWRDCGIAGCGVGSVEFGERDLREFL